MDRCPRCDMPEATDALWAHSGEGDGCQCDGCRTHCFGGCQPADWRARALAAEQRYARVVWALSSERDEPVPEDYARAMRDVDVAADVAAVSRQVREIQNAWAALNAEPPALLSAEEYARRLRALGEAIENG